MRIEKNIFGPVEMGLSTKALLLAFDNIEQ